MAVEKEYLFDQEEYRQYGNVPVMEILQKHRFSSSFSDFVTQYTAVAPRICGCRRRNTMPWKRMTD